IVVLTAADAGFSSASPLYLDAKGHQTTTNSGIPVITDVPSTTAGAALVYVDSSFKKVFAAHGGNIVTNGDFSNFVPSNGTGGGWTTSNVDENGGYRSCCGYPAGGTFLLNSNGDPYTDPTITQTLT